MHLLCPDTECAGNDLPAGTDPEAGCAYCGLPLQSEAGNVLVQGPAPLVDGALPEGFNALMDAMKDAGHDVRIVELTAVRHEDRLLVSSVDEHGELLGVEVCEGERADEVASAMELMA